MPMSYTEFEDRLREFNEWHDRLAAQLVDYEVKYGPPPAPKNDSPRDYVRKERERNANRDKPIRAPRDGFINDYD